jgi:hypothetical protein
MAVGTRMQQRRATEAVWTTSEYILSAGELGVTTDTGIIKIGDGVNSWSELDPAFNSQYLPILGTAANSELLDGIGSESFAKVVDVPTNEDLDAAIVTAKTVSIGRVLAADFTLQASDVGSVLLVGNVNWTPDIVGTIPTNATVSIPVGSTIDVASVNKGSVKLVPSGGVILRGNGMTYGGNAVTRFLKTATDEWLVLTKTMSAPPTAKRFIPTTFNLQSGFHTIVPLDGSNSGVDSHSQMIDSLGSGVQYDSTTSIYRLYCRREGWYDIVFQFHLQSVTANRGMASIYVNGIGQHSGRAGSLDYSLTGIATHAQLPLNVGDYVEGVAHQNTGSSRLIINDPASSSFLQWRWVAPL